MYNIPWPLSSAHLVKDVSVYSGLRVRGWNGHKADTSEVFT